MASRAGRYEACCVREGQWTRWSVLTTLLLEFQPDAVIDAGWSLHPPDATLRALHANSSIAGR